MKRLADGWRIECLPVVGGRRRLGDRHFVFGADPPPGLAAGRLPGTGEPFIVVGTGGGYLLFYTDFLSGVPREIFPRRAGNLGEREPIGNWERDHNQFYPAIYPIGGGLFHIVAGRSSGRSTGLEYCRKLDDTPALDFFCHMEFLPVAGIPAAVDWNRNGRYDLLVGGRDGALRRHRRLLDQSGFAFEIAGVPVTAAGCPIEFPGWLYPAVVDWRAAGRSDLLVGVASGDVWLLRDVGGPDEVAYDRGRVVETLEGPLCVGSFAAPAAIADAAGRCTHLLVMSGAGELFACEIGGADTYITADLGRAFGEQGGRVSRRYRKGAWWLRPRFPAAASGQLLTTCRQCLPDDFRPGLTFDALVENRTPEIALKPPFPGRFEVYVGLYRPAALPFRAAPGEIPSDVPAGRLQVRRASDPTAEFVCPGEAGDMTQQEVFAGVKDLRRDSLVFSQGLGDYKRHGGYPCYLDYVRLVPARGPAAARRLRRCVSAIFDTFDWTILESTDTPAKVEDVIEKHAACGFNRIYYKAGGGGWEYPSRVPGAEPIVDYPGSRTPARWPREDFVGHILELNRFEIAARACRRRGIEFYSWVRITNQAEHLGSGWYMDRFFVEHPELWDGYRYGQPRSAISLAHDEAQDYLFRLFEEQAAWGVDGFLIDFLRTPPTMVFPESLVREFRRRYGVDPRARPPQDPRILDLRARMLTDFLVRMRERLGRKGNGPRIHVRVSGLSRRGGWDVARWMRTGAVDAVIIEHTDSLDPAEPPDLGALIGLARGGPCQVIAGFYRPYWGKDRNRPIHEDVVRRQAERYFALGADGVSFYESAAILTAPRMRQAIMRLTRPRTPRPIANV